MNRSSKRNAALLIVVACMGAGAFALDGDSLEGSAYAQKGKRPAVTQAKGKDGGAVAAGARDGGLAPSKPETASASGGDGGAGVVESKTLDGGTRVFKFGELEVEGRLRSPQIVYFLRRVRAEFAAGDLGHRSFMGELSQTRNTSAF